MVITKKISLRTKGDCDIIDITGEVASELSDCGLSAGTVTIFVAGSTAGLSTIEYEPGLVADLKNAWQRLVPPNIGYQHDSRWGDGNGFAHIRACLLGPSLVVPFQDKHLLLGTWQQIVLVDFDNRPRSRQVIMQFMGE
jgi:secondary thiamine-phosphate synthase enzyme